MYMEGFVVFDRAIIMPARTRWSYTELPAGPLAVDASAFTPHTLPAMPPSIQAKSRRRIRGLILAGGGATRFDGRDKALIPLGDKPLLAHVIERLAPQVHTLVLSSNAPPERYADFKLPVLPDRLPGLGPLAGVHAALTAWPDDAIVSVAVDLPFLPIDAVARLRRGGSGDGCRHAAVDNRHVLLVLWPAGIGKQLANFLRHEQSLHAWLTLHSKPVAFDGSDAFDLNINVNTPAELRAAQRRLQQAPAVVDVE